MSPYTPRLIHADHDPSDPVPDRSALEKEEHEALDAYSRVIVTVAEALGPAVVNLRAERARARAGPAARGPDSCSRPMASSSPTITWSAARTDCGSA